MTARRVARGLVRRGRLTLAAARDRRFRTALREDRDGPTLILSPHFDDAVINCWSVLTAPSAVVVANVFTEAPAGGRTPAWDRLCGAEDARALMRERAAEDARVLAGIDRAAVNLGFVGRSHRGRSAPPAYAALDASLRQVAPGFAAVYAPLAVSHPDHRHVRGYAERLAGAGVPVRLYADAPYATRMGWPAWVTGTPPLPRLALDDQWDSAPGFPPRSAARPVRLGADAAGAKLGAMRGYETQFAALDGGPLGLLSNPAVHAFEVFWTLR